MKINSINLANLRNNFQYNSTKNQQNNASTLELNYAKLPSSKNYLALFNFTGGSSINLAQTYEKLQDKQYPHPSIKENIKKELDNKNPNNKTLYDFHFDRYKGVLDCYSLNELKEKFPEFANCQSSWSTDAREGSFLADWQFNESNIFPNDEDLTLQLIKLYWGQGFSLNDLSDYLKENSKDGKAMSLYYTMARKLNIPLMNNTYAHILKLSNKEYNEKLTSEMSLKRKEANEQRKQKEEGEPVYIPRGPLSEAHKRHISEGLKRYFEEHPEAVLKMSQRQKEFYRNNKHEHDEFSFVMNYAWNNTQEGKSVAKHLSKFLKKYYRLNLEEIDLTQNLSSNQKTALEEFWDKNTWAKGKFSTAVKKGWESLKKNPFKTDYAVLDLIPKTLSQNMKQFAINHGLEVPEVNLGIFEVTSKDNTRNEQEQKKIEEISQKAIDLYEQYYPESKDDSASAKQLALICIENDLYYNPSKLPRTIRGNQKKIETLKVLLNRSIGNAYLYQIAKIPNKGAMKIPIDGVTNDELSKILQTLALGSIVIDCPEFIEYINKKLDEAYCTFVNSGNGKADIEKFLRIN